MYARGAVGRPRVQYASAVGGPSVLTVLRALVLLAALALLIYLLQDPGLQAYIRTLFQ